MLPLRASLVLITPPCSHSPSTQNARGCRGAGNPSPPSPSFTSPRLRSPFLCSLSGSSRTSTSARVGQSVQQVGARDSTGEWVAGGARRRVASCCCSCCAAAASPSLLRSRCHQLRAIGAQGRSEARALTSSLGLLVGAARRPLSHAALCNYPSFRSFR